MKLCVFGSRRSRFFSPDVGRELVIGFLDSFYNVLSEKGYVVEEVVHGASPLGGVDWWAEEWAERKGIRVRRFPPVKGLPSPFRFFRRNYEMAEYADLGVGFYAEEPRVKSGTTNTLCHFRELGKPVVMLVVKTALEEKIEVLPKEEVDEILRKYKIMYGKCPR